MFQLNHNEKFTLKRNQIANAIYNNPDCGPIFGFSCDIFISNDANINSFSRADIGNSY